MLLSHDTDNPVFGRTANPFSPRHSAGGASGGEAAAIAAGLAPLGFGTDLGGGLRIAAHFSGVAALKPTPLRLPNRGIDGPLPGQNVVPLQSGPIAKKVRDLELVLDTFPATHLHGLDVSVPPVEDPPAAGLRELRVGVFTDDGLLAPSSAIIGAVERAADALRAAGVGVVPFTPPALPELFYDLVALFAADGGHELKEALAGGIVAESLRPLHNLTRMPHTVRAGLGQMARVAGDRELARLSHVFGEKSVYELRRLTLRMHAAAEELRAAIQRARLDALLCPPFATPALLSGSGGELLVGASFAMVWNAAGFCGGVVPVTRVHAGETVREGGRGRLIKTARRIDEESKGLPVGAQIVAPPWRDRTVLALLAAIEKNVEADVDYPRTPVG
jgi:fatty acid amide hydrolase